MDPLYLKKLQVPEKKVDVVLDTDCYNEIDDQFAMAYLLRCPERVNVKGITIAPFLNRKSVSPADGMEKSYHEAKKVLELTLPGKEKPPVWRGSERFMPGETEPVDSEAARELVRLAMTYPKEQPLYIVAIGACTNVASALLLEPQLRERVVVVWLGGHALHYKRDNKEFNLRQDVAAGRVLFGCGVPLVQLPCRGVVSQFTTNRYELETLLLGKNSLADYLARNTISHCEETAQGRLWSKPLWDVTAVAWLLNNDQRFLYQELIPSPIPQYDHTYATDDSRHLIQYVYYVERDALFRDMVRRLTED